VRPSGPTSRCAFSTGSRIISRAIVPKRRGRTGRCSSKANFWFNVDRNAFTPLPSLKFQGGYAETAYYVLTGETRHYNPGSAARGSIVPASPFSLTGGGWARGKLPVVSALSISMISSPPPTASSADDRPIIRWR